MKGQPVQVKEPRALPTIEFSGIPFTIFETRRDVLKGDTTVLYPPSLSPSSSLPIGVTIHPRSSAVRMGRA